MTKLETTAYLSINQILGDKEYIQIEIKESKSRILVCRLQLSFEEYGRLLTRRTMPDIPIQINQNENIGKTLIIKNQEIEIEEEVYRNSTVRKEWIEAVLPELLTKEATTLVGIKPNDFYRKNGKYFVKITYRAYN